MSGVGNYTFCNRNIETKGTNFINRAVASNLFNKDPSVLFGHNDNSIWRG